MPPNHLMKRYHFVTLSSDSMFVNGIPFFVTFIHHIKFIAYLITKDQHINILVKTIK